MQYILDGFIEAFQLLISFDPEIYKIIGLSVIVSMTSTVIASVIGIILGIALGLGSFKGKQRIMRLVYAMMALPPVVIGLLTAIVISRRGPLGFMSLMFTPTAMIVAQTILITPIVTGIVASAAKESGREVSEVSKLLGGSRLDRAILVIKELRRTIAVAVSTGFGRGISEVGAVMIVGGNIQGHTRVMTTFIAMNNSMGNYSKSLAMGLVLIGIAVFTNSVIHRNAEEGK
jgi:tungstate transport system permease protein